MRKTKRKTNVLNFPTPAAPPTVLDEFDLNRLVTGGKDGFEVYTIVQNSHFAFKGDLAIIDSKDKGKGTDLLLCQRGTLTGVVPYHLALMIVGGDCSILGKITHIVRCVG